MVTQETTTMPLTLWRGASFASSVVCPSCSFPDLAAEPLSMLLCHPPQLQWRDTRVPVHNIRHGASQLVGKAPSFNEKGSTVRQGVPRPKCIRPVFRLTVVCSFEPWGCGLTLICITSWHMWHRCGAGRGSRGSRQIPPMCQWHWQLLVALCCSK